MWISLEVVTVFLAVMTVVLAWLTWRTSVRAIDLQRREIRRAFAERLASYALWFCERVVAGHVDAGPTGALAERTFALRYLAHQSGESGATDLLDWALGLLEEVAKGESELHAFEEAHLIAHVASAWVHDGTLDVHGHGSQATGQSLASD